MEKRCSKCREVKPATVEYFSPHKRGKYGLQPRCRVCDRQRCQIWRANNKELALEAVRKWRILHYRQEREKVKQWRQNNPEKMRAFERKYRSTPDGKAKAREYQRKSRLKNPAKFAARFRQWWLKNREQSKPKEKAYRAIHRALKEGRLIRPSMCSQCGCSCRPHAHHHLGYAPEHRLDVIFLCAICHSGEHEKMREQKR